MYYYDATCQKSYDPKDGYETREEAWKECQEFCRLEGYEPDESMVFEINE
jgi:hypothetical protein